MRRRGVPTGVRRGRFRPLLLLLLACVLLSSRSVGAAPDIAPGLLGMYRKTIEVDLALFAGTARYGVDHRMARAVMLFESGGNPDWTSPPARRGYFQLTPGLMRLLGAPTNVEAGVKYLARLQNQFSREDYVLAAYKLGSDRVSEDAPLDLPTLRFVVGVGHYKSVLQEHEPAIRSQAERLDVTRVGQGETWKSVARRLGLPAAVLRLYNPRLAPHALRAGASVASPAEVSPALAAAAADHTKYVSRIGDTAEMLAGVFGLDMESLRRTHSLWELHPLAVGTKLAAAKPAGTAKSVRTKTRASASAGRTATTAYRIRSGDTLSGIARRYGTTVAELVRVNRLPNRRIRAGAMLRIPTR